MQTPPTGKLTDRKIEHPAEEHPVDENRISKHESPTEEQLITELNKAAQLIRKADGMLDEVFAKDPGAEQVDTHITLEHATASYIEAMTLARGDVDVLGPEPFLGLAEASEAIAQSPQSSIGQKIVGAHHAIDNYEKTIEFVENPKVVADIRSRQAELSAILDSKEPAEDYDHWVKAFQQLRDKSIAEIQMQEEPEKSLPFVSAIIPKVAPRRHSHSDESKIGRSEYVRRPAKHVKQVVGRVAAKTISIVKL